MTGKSFPWLKLERQKKKKNGNFFSITKIKSFAYFPRLKLERQEKRNGNFFTITKIKSFAYFSRLKRKKKKVAGKSFL